MTRYPHEESLIGLTSHGDLAGLRPTVDVAAYDAVLFAGGHGTMWDFTEDPDVARVVRDVYEDGGVIAAVCHGPAALVGSRCPTAGRWSRENSTPARPTSNPTWSPTSG